MMIGTVIGAIARIANRTLGAGNPSGEESPGFGDVFKSLIASRGIEAEPHVPDAVRPPEDDSTTPLGSSSAAPISMVRTPTESRTFDPGMLALFHSVGMIADAPEDGASDPDGPAPRSDLTLIRSDSMGTDPAPTKTTRTSTASFAGDLAPALTFSRGPIGSDPVVGITPKAQPPVVADDADASALGSAAKKSNPNAPSADESPAGRRVQETTLVPTDDASSSEEARVSQSRNEGADGEMRPQSGADALVRTAAVNATPTSVGSGVTNATAGTVIRTQIPEREDAGPVADHARARTRDGETSSQAPRQHVARVPSSPPPNQSSQSVDRTVTPTSVVPQEGMPTTQDVRGSATLSHDDPSVAQKPARSRSDRAPHETHTRPNADGHPATEHPSVPTMVRHVASAAMADVPLQALSESPHKVRFGTQRETADDRDSAARSVEADAGRHTANGESHHRPDQRVEDLQIRPSVGGSRSSDTPTFVLRDNVVPPADMRMTHTAPAAGSDVVDGSANVARVSDAPTFPTGDTAKASGVATIRVSDETGAEARVRVSVRGGHVTTRIIHDDAHAAQQLSARADELHGSLAARGFEGARTSIRAVQQTNHQPALGVSGTDVGMVGEPHATSDGRHSQRDGDEPRRSPHHQEQDERKQDERSHGRSRRDQERERKQR